MRILILAGVLAAAVLTSCGAPARVSPQATAPPQPDLVPMKRAAGQGADGLCYQTNQGGGSLLVAVQNIGTTPVPNSTTTVEFFPGGLYDLPTPALSPGASVNLSPAAFPTSCFNPDCDFKVTVDSKHVVQEFNEGNNISVGVCTSAMAQPLGSLPAQPR